MNDSTECPTGTAWCEQHRVGGITDDQPIECRQPLFTKHTPLAESGLPAVALYVSKVNVFHRPGMGLTQYDHTPQSISPQEARELAAALLHGAAIVEAANTAICPGCGRSAPPGELEETDGGVCFACDRVQRVERMAAETQRRRAAMSVVRGGTGSAVRP